MLCGAVIHYRHAQIHCTYYLTKTIHVLVNSSHILSTTMPTCHKPSTSNSNQLHWQQNTNVRQIQVFGSHRKLLGSTAELRRLQGWSHHHHHAVFNGRFPVEPALTGPLGFLPTPVQEENLWGQVAEAFFVDTHPSCHPTISLKTPKKTESTDTNQ